MFVLSVATVLLHTCQFLLDYCTVHTRIVENIHVHKPPWKIQMISEPWDYHIVMPAKRACLNSKSRPILDRMNLWSVVTAVKGANMCYDVVGRCHSWSSSEMHKYKFNCWNNILVMCAYVMCMSSFAFSQACTRNHHVLTCHDLFFVLARFCVFLEQLQHLKADASTCLWSSVLQWPKVSNGKFKFAICPFFKSILRWWNLKNFLCFERIFCLEISGFASRSTFDSWHRSPEIGRVPI